MSSPLSSTTQASMDTVCPYVEEDCSLGKRRRGPPSPWLASGSLTSTASPPLSTITSSETIRRQKRRRTLDPAPQKPSVPTDGRRSPTAPTRQRHKPRVQLSVKVTERTCDVKPIPLRASDHRGKARLRQIKVLDQNQFHRVSLCCMEYQNGECQLVVDKASHKIKAKERGEDPVVEARLLHRLQHPNIVKLCGYLELNGCAHSLMQYLSGGDLFKRIAVTQGKGLDMNTVRPWMFEAAQALRYCHQQGVAHLDISPENLGFDADGRVHLMDFGMASKSNAPLVGMKGKARYCAPEVAGGQVYDGASADVFSLGVTFLVAVLGRTAFAEPRSTDSQFRTLRQQGLDTLLCDLGRRNSFSDSAVELLEGMLAPQSHRLTLDQVLQHSFFRSTGDKL